MNDRKKDLELKTQQMHDVIQTGEATNPLKKISTAIYDTWLYEGLIAKKEKYESYTTDGQFEELILLCHSNIITVEELRADKVLLEWTQYLLKKDNYPFDKVIFVGPTENDAIQVYNKSAKETAPRYASQDHMAKGVEWGVLPVNKDLNFFEIASRDPIIKSPKPVVDRRNHSESDNPKV